MYMEVDFNLVAVYNDKIYESVLSYSPNHDTWFLGEQIYKAIVFDFYIPFSESGDVEFYMQSCNGLRFPARIFLENQCRLTEKKHAFVVGENVIISKHSNNNKLKVDSLSINKLAIFLKDYIDSNFKDKKYVNEISVINDYYNLYSIFAKKRIWIFIDKSSRADDNAEHLYKYCCNIDDGIEKYFVLSKDSVDVERFNSIGNVIYFGSHEHKLLMLFAERFISSYADDLFNNPFRVNNDIYSLYKGLCKYDFVFLQHGIIKDNLSHGHNRILRNHKIFVTSTKLEYDSIFENNYGYSDKVVKLTGLPRYDNLYDNKEKKIVIMPTWRENLFIEKEKYNIDFANSDFCKHICDLLCDERLVDEAMKLDYEILFMPHPMTLNQIDDFKMNSYIQLIDSNISYQQIFSMGALIVTDYSSAVFDFAYLKKPVLYFQFDEGNYEKGYFDYETMGFGEVAREKEQLVDLLVEYMKNDCEMKQEYIERVGQCFAYSDRNNCKRVYGEILKI